MFIKRPSAQSSSSLSASLLSPSQNTETTKDTASADTLRSPEPRASQSQRVSSEESGTRQSTLKSPRKSDASGIPSPNKRRKPNKAGSLGDISKKPDLKTFFKPKQPGAVEGNTADHPPPVSQENHTKAVGGSEITSPENNQSRTTCEISSTSLSQETTNDVSVKPTPSTDDYGKALNSIAEEQVASHSETRQSWSKVFTKKGPPLCEGHDEPCICLTTKKPGINCGRQFWICARPIGPSGEKEEGTEWRCSTFIWSSNWNG